MKANTSYGQFTILPPNHTLHITITASVGFVSPDGHPNMFMVIENKRGWDIPGGHVEPGETALQTFERELLEESGYRLLEGASLMAILQSNSNPTTGIAVYRGMCNPRVFSPQLETVAARFVPAGELLDIYFGDKAILQDLMVYNKII